MPLQELCHGEPSLACFPAHPSPPCLRISAFVLTPDSACYFAFCALLQLAYVLIQELFVAAGSLGSGRDQGGARMERSMDTVPGCPMHHRSIRARPRDLCIGNSSIRAPQGSKPWKQLLLLPIATPTREVFKRLSVFMKSCNNHLANSSYKIRNVFWIANTTVFLLLLKLRTVKNHLQSYIFT